MHLAGPRRSELTLFRTHFEIEFVDWTLGDRVSAKLVYPELAWVDVESS